jgi:hypothetical protein
VKELERKLREEQDRQERTIQMGPVPSLYLDKEAQ